MLYLMTFVSIFHYEISNTWRPQYEISTDVGGALSNDFCQYISLRDIKHNTWRPQYEISTDVGGALSNDFCQYILLPDIKHVKITKRDVYRCRWCFIYLTFASIFHYQISNTWRPLYEMSTDVGGVLSTDFCQYISLRDIKHMKTAIRDI